METSYLQKRGSDILQRSSKWDIAICFLKIVNVRYPKERFKATIEPESNQFNNLVISAKIFNSLLLNQIPKYIETILG